MTDRLQEASRLISRHLDGVMTDEEESQLAGLMQQDPEVIDLYVRLMQVHGQLTWGAAQHTEATGGTTAVAAAADAEAPEPEVDTSVQRSITPRPTTPRRRQRGRTAASWAVPGTLLLIALVVAGGAFLQDRQPDSIATEHAPDPVTPERAIAAGTDVADPRTPGPLEPLRFDSLDQPPEASPQHAERHHLPSAAEEPVFVAGSVLDEDVIAVIDARIAEALQANGVPPSPVASMEEWTRRAWLTLVGRIPSLDEMSTALASADADHRADVVDRLLQSPERSQRLAEVWTSLLVGRAERPQIDRPALQDYLVAAFEDNRPWIQVVGELVSAQGRSDSNGATNFLLAHLDNQATPATAVTARLFLGEQLQCVQCHHHPFAPERKQQEYWAFNAFFQNSQRASVERSAEAIVSGRRPVRLIDREAGGMTFFETLNGRQEAVVATYDGQRIPADQKVSRRAVLAELLAEDSGSRVARAMVNRVWADFFGFGFTNPVDDMGSHATVSHPELLDALTDAFVASGYDLRRLQRWIALSAAWERTSRSVAGNEQDAPEAGVIPLFSRVYPRRMAPEQVYDSIRVAIRAVGGQATAVEPQSDHRRQWVSQFVRPYNTDENDEANGFNGSVAQAMVMMNGADINTAIRQAGQAFLGSQSQLPPADSVLEQVALAVLTRSPTEGESAVFRRQLRQLRRTADYQQALPQVTEDMLWAYLNSSEFLLIH